MDDSPALELDGVSLSYGDRTVLADVSGCIARGGSWVIGGPAGAGKTSLLYVCAGLAEPTAGRVALGGYDLARWRSPALFRRGIRCGFLFQEDGLVSNLTILANVTTPLAYHRRGLGLTRDDVADRARRALDQTGVDVAYLASLPAHVSHGVRRQAAMARVLAIEPNYVFLDDPTAGLESATAERIEQFARAFVQRPDVTVMIATSDPGLADRVGGQLLTLAGGNLHAADAAEANS